MNRFICSERAVYMHVAFTEADGVIRRYTVRTIHLIYDGAHSQELNEYARATRLIAVSKINNV